MDERKPKGIQKTIPIGFVLICLGLALLVACKKPSKGPYVSYSPASGIFACDIPSDWLDMKSESGGFPLSIISPDDVGLISAHIRISDEPWHTVEKLKEDMAWDRKNWAGDPAFTQDALKSISFGGFKGWTYTMTTTNALAAGAHHLDSPPDPVRYKETFIYFETSGGQYMIEYAAPVEIYDKHRPALEHLLKTFRWAGKS